MIAEPDRHLRTVNSCIEIFLFDSCINSAHGAAVVNLHMFACTRSLSGRAVPDLHIEHGPDMHVGNFDHRLMGQMCQIRTFL
jgi:hypothetical protein